MSRGRRILFVTGLHRSGTTLVHSILRNHPDCSGFINTGAGEDEGQHLQDVVPIAGKFGGAGKFGFDERSHMDEDSELCTEESATRIWNSWSPHWDLTREILLEKSPPTLVRTRYFQKLFPNAEFLIVVRHPIAVSMATQKWSRTTPVELLKHWIVSHLRFEKDSQRLKRVLIVRYEDVVSRTNETFAEIFEFFGLKSHDVESPTRGGLNRYYDTLWEDYLANAPDALEQYRAIVPVLSPLALRYRYGTKTY